MDASIPPEIFHRVHSNDLAKMVTPCGLNHLQSMLVLRKNIITSNYPVPSSEGSRTTWSNCAGGDASR